MNCRNVQQHLQDFLDHTVNKELYDTIQIHLDQCDSCYHEFQLFKKMLSGLQESDYPKLTTHQWEYLHDSIMAALPTYQDKFNVVKSASPFPFLYSIPIRTIAAVFILSLVTISAFFYPRITDISQFLSLKRIVYPKVIAINGRAFSTNNSSTPIQIGSDFAMLPGVSIHTDSSSSLQIKIDDKSAIGLRKNTQCSIKDYTNKKTIFDLEAGQLNAKVSKRKPNQLFRIETPNAFCEVVGTAFDVATQHDLFHKQYITTLRVHEGIVKFGSSKNACSVGAGKAVTIFGDSISETFSSSDSFIQQLCEYPGKSKISITSQPSNAHIFIDGVPSGTTPFTGNIKYGLHSIRLSRNGFKEWAGTVEINAYASVDTLVTMRRVPGTTAISNNKKSIGTVVTTGELLENAILQDAFQLITQGYYHEAIVELQQLITPSVSSALKAIAYHKLSVCYKNIGDISNALTMLNTILKGDFASEQKGLALFERATIYKTILHDPKSAITDYYAYLSHYPKGIWAEETALSLAELLRHEKKFEETAKVYRLFCNNYKDNSQYEQALYILGNIYFNNLSDYNRAMSTYTRLIQEFPRSRFADDATYWSAACLLHLGHASRALVEFSNYLTRYPEGKWATEAKSRLHRIETSEAR